VKNEEVKELIEGKVGGKKRSVTIQKGVGIRAITIQVNGDDDSLKTLTNTALKVYKETAKDIKEEYRPSEIA